jgi:glutathione S-transferase
LSYTLYIGNKNYSSWSLRPWLLLTQLDIEFNEVVNPFDDGGYGVNWTRFRTFSPNGLVPCLHDEKSGIVVWESLAIVEYIAEEHPQAWPADPVARAWARSAAAEMHAGFSALRNECPMTVGMRVRLHEISPALKRDLDRVTELWSEGIDRFGGPYLAGPHFTAVDAFYAPVVYRLQTYDLTDAAKAAYCSAILSTRGMQLWTDAALAEPWRESGHELEIAGLGEVLQDLRQPAE